MISLFKDLNFVVKAYSNDKNVSDLTAGQIEKLLLKAADSNHDGYDAVACVIMSHGHLGSIYGSDRKAIDILQLASFFYPGKCQSLNGKPKLFFIQSCQNETDCKSDLDQLTTNPDPAPPQSIPVTNITVSNQGDSADPDPWVPTVPPRNDLTAGVQPSSDVDKAEYEHLGHLCQDDISVPKIRSKMKTCLVPSQPDFLMSYSTLPLSKSHRDETVGSLYIKLLAKRLMEPREIDLALKLVILDVQQRVDEINESWKVVDEYGRKYSLQIPFHLTTGMCKLLYLT